MDREPFHSWTNTEATLTISNILWNEKWIETYEKIFFPDHKLWVIALTQSVFVQGDHPMVIMLWKKLRDMCKRKENFREAAGRPSLIETNHEKWIY